MLEVPVGLADLVDAVAADEHGGRADQHVEAAEGRGHDVEQSGVIGDIAEIGGERQMRPALEIGDDRLDLLLAEIDGGDARAGRGEGERHLAADAAGPAGEEHALALEPGGEVPGHAVDTLGGRRPRPPFSSPQTWRLRFREMAGGDARPPREPPRSRLPYECSA